jgi:flagellar hook-associated protein 2
MQVTSRRTGAAGELVLDEEGLDLDLATLSAAQDAKVLLGGAGGGGLLVTSSSNTLAGTVPGLTVELTGVSDQPVHVTASKNNDKLLEDMAGLIQNINEALDRIDEYASYDAETERAGILLGDSSLRSAEQRLLRLFSGFVPNASGGITRFGDLGISVKNGRLEFDQAKFTEQLENNPEGLTDFFTDVDQGFGKHVNDQLEALNDPTGLLKSREKSLEKQRTLLDTRVDQLDALLERKRARLMRQFQAMETALAQLQAQQSALGQLSSLAAQFGAA